ncbi:hypothetical protein ymoll0001_430 [Yersinia mollaretii ATCC 43969]|uniref:Uncharacterized protein n=1 Tax=Yersinia mollaretii (strain ATCC 43969 / DSM 18520 / CIP 103324 / CNY 7263 / WAIP 204) TaxID=349967 RepID=A0ABM9Y914_YERMW|nr:hypothetical protein ymoll0001_430 [Yersinia mollaretii ATCC 43969]
MNLDKQLNYPISLEFHGGIKYARGIKNIWFNLMLVQYRVNPAAPSINDLGCH